MSVKVKNVGNLKTPLTLKEEEVLQRIHELFDNDENRQLEVYPRANINGAYFDFLCLERSHGNVNGGVWLIAFSEQDLTNYCVLPKEKWYLKDEFNEARAKGESPASAPSPLNFLTTLQRAVEAVSFPLTEFAVKQNSAKHGDKRRSSLVKAAGLFEPSSLLDPASLQNLESVTLLSSTTPLQLWRAFFSSINEKFSEQSYQEIKAYFAKLMPKDEPLLLNAEQERILRSFKEGHRRKKIVGPAGSGKTELLAAMIANSLENQEKALVLTFNITLRHFLTQRIERWLQSGEGIQRQNLVITHYHDLIQKQLTYAEISYSKSLLEISDQEGIFKEVRRQPEKYDAIFIDEFQDYKENWIKNLEQYFLEPGGTYVVCGDPNQNVYDRKMEDQQLPRVQIPGKPSVLRAGHRSPTLITQLGAAFQQKYLGDKYQVPAITPQINLFDTAGAEDDKVILCNTRSQTDAFRKLNQYFENHGVAPSEVAICTFSSQGLRKAIDKYSQVSPSPRRITSASQTALAAHEKANWSDFDAYYLEKSMKLSFKSDQGTKAVTVKSLKGFEVDTLVLVLDNVALTPKSEVAAETSGVAAETSGEQIESTRDEGKANGEYSAEEFYTALTRAKNRLIVVYDSQGLGMPVLHAETQNLNKKEFVNFLEEYQSPKVVKWS